VKQEYYGKFAAYLAERGFTVLTFDYRGIGRSGSFRLKNARMRDWAELDAAARARISEKEFSAKLMAIGHSFGGQSFALIPGAERLRRRRGRLAERLLAPLARRPARGNVAAHARAAAGDLAPVRLFSRCRARQGENIPAGVAIEWASWCRDPDYLVGALDAKEQYARFSAPLRLYWVADDPYARSRPPKRCWSSTRAPRRSSRE